MRFWKDISGRYLDRGAATALLRDGRTGTLDGFTARDGRTYRGHLEIDRENWKVVVRSEGWTGEGESAQPEYEVNPEPLGRCPICEEFDVVETPTQFVCTGRLKALDQKAARSAAVKRGETPAPAPEAKPCGWVLPRTVCKREITREEALHYLQSGRTELLTDFTSRFGRPFSAVLFLKENGRHGFEFPPRGQAAEGAAPRSEGEAAPAPPKRAPRRRGRAAEPAAAPEERAAPRKTRRPAGKRVARRAAGPKVARVVRRGRRRTDGGSGASESPREG
jgi:DNA topoisomerase-3